jgi:hypothetical protein
MKPILKMLPLLAVIAVSALSGAIASTVVEHAANAATLTPVQQDPELTNLLKYIKVGAAGDVTINGTNVLIKGSSVNVQGAAQTTIKGAIVSIN